MRLPLYRICAIILTTNRLAAQALPENTNPGICLVKPYGGFNTKSAGLIRSHHLKSFSEIHYRLNLSVVNGIDTIRSVDTTSFGFSYKNDTLLVSQDHRLIYKFDGHDTLRESIGYSRRGDEIEIYATSFFDSLGRLVKQVEDTGTSRWSYYSDWGQSVEVGPDFNRQIFFHGPKIIDSIRYTYRRPNTRANRYSTLFDRPALITNHYQSLNKLVSVHTLFEKGGESVDSVVYDRQGIVAWRLEYSLINGKSLCPVRRTHYDRLGNIDTLLTRPFVSIDMPVPCSMSDSMVTVTTVYQYDQLGRPVKRLSKFLADGHPWGNTYKWRDDDLIDSESGLDFDSPEMLEERFEYTFF